MNRAYLLAIALFVAVCAVTAQSNEHTPSKTSQTGDASYAGLVDKHCVSCHNDKSKTAGLSLQSLSIAAVPDHADVWEKVLRKIKTGEMPPSSVRVRPEPAAATAFATFLETTLDKAALAAPNPGRPPIHRLNRAEYSNAIRDL